MSQYLIVTPFFFYVIGPFPGGILGGMGGEDRRVPLISLPLEVIGEHLTFTISLYK